VIGDATGTTFHIFTWQGVRLAPGENIIALEGRCAGQVVKDEARWALAPAKDTAGVTPASPATERYRQPVFQKVSTQEGVTFSTATSSTGAAVKLALDVYQPEGDTQKARAAILWIHGGGFRTGTDRRQKYIVTLATDFARRGYVSIAPDYRVRAAQLTDADRLPALIDALDDCRAALAWVKAHAAEYGIDAGRIVVAGGSAGGMVAVNLVAQENAAAVKASAPRILALVDLWGSPAANLTVGSVDKNYPPTLIVHGTADQTVPFAQSEALVAALKSAGVTHQLMAIDGAPHTPTDHLDAIASTVSAFVYKALPTK